MMRAALALARRSLGQTWPNPAVGCVIARDGAVLARGRTREGGRPHAEADAIAQATGISLEGATVFVTLEPCAHHGRTPPCADALVAAGVARVVSALEDPDPRVRGAGHARLRAAGIEVEVGEGAREAAEINAGFLLRVAKSRPLFHLKLATSLDGRIATSSGESRWITGDAARADGHRLRASHDAILVGSGTALADDPELTCRLAGLEGRSPLRLVLDSRARLPLTSKLVTSAGATPVWLLCTPAAPDVARQVLIERGVKVIEVAADEAGRVDVAAAADVLAAQGLTRVLVEGGGAVAAAFLRAGLIDRVSCYRSGVVLGGGGRSAIDSLSEGRLDFAPRFDLQSQREVGRDTLETWRRRT
jgi:diaminohydroxyphosphoribosylaminopyrimidine deaminase / 5-amino-6-(5-phosphoribosylamino)uracil reductase